MPHSPTLVLPTVAPVLACQVEVDKPTGAHWLTRAAEAGHAKACNRLGWCCK